MRISDAPPLNIGAKPWECYGRLRELPRRFHDGFRVSLVKIGCVGLGRCHVREEKLEDLS